MKTAAFINRLACSAIGKIVFSLVILFLFTSSQLVAQEVKKVTPNYRLAEKFTRENVEKLLHSTSVETNWIDNTDKFWYKFKTGRGTDFNIVDPVNKTRQPVFDNAKLASALSKFTHKPYDQKNLPISKLKFVRDLKAIEIEVDSLKFEYDLSTLELTFIDTVRKSGQETSGRFRMGRGRFRGSGARGWKSYSTDSTLIAFAKNHNLYVIGADSIEHQLTIDGERWYSFAASSGDTTQNKRVRANVRWFKDSHKLYITRRDQRKVNELWVINSVAEPRPTLETYKYAMPGEKNVSQSELWIFDAEKRENVKVKADKLIDQAFSGTYAGDTDDKLFFIRRSRDFKDLEVCKADTETGDVTVLFAEHNEPYINARGGLQLYVLNNGEDLIWWSDLDGWSHFYLYDEYGNLRNQITSGTFVAALVTEIDTTGRILYFSACGREPGHNPNYSHHYRVNFDGSGLKLLNPEDATHNISMSPSKNYFVDNFSRIDRVPRAVLRDNNGSMIMSLEKVDISRLSEAGWKMPEPFTLKAADGITDLYGNIFKPFDFDPKKKYPIIAHVYPGPQTEGVTYNFSPTNSNVALAQLGFIVIQVGNRGGTPKRNNFYHTYGYGNARDYGLADKKFAIEQLASRYSFIDINRIGVYGHSGGGFMSTAAMLVYPDFFKVAVSSSGNHDNNIYNITWGEFNYGVEMVKQKKRSTKGGERSRDSSEEGEEKEEIVWKTNIATNPEIAKNLKGHLLLVTGDIDNNVHPGGTIRVANALIKANKRFDFMIMPGQRHSYGNYQKYFVRLLWDYFCQHLHGDSNKNVDLFLLDKNK